MTMLAGSVAIAALDGSGGATSRTGSGYALTAFDALVAAKPLTGFTIPTIGQTTQPYQPARPASTDDHNTAVAAKLKYYQSLAADANVMASVITYIINNADVTVTITNQSCGVVTNPHDPIDPPSSPVDLPGHIT